MTVPTSLRDTSVKRFTPSGVVDSLDANDSPPGSCAALVNLVFDPSTKGVLAPRPAATLLALTTGAGGATAGAIAVYKIVGDIMYGLFGNNFTSGNDAPFAYNLRTNTFITVTLVGVGPTDLPDTQPSGSGDWNPFPPTMDLVGTKLIVTHPGFLTTAFFFGWFDISVPTAPTYSQGNTAAGSAITFSNTTGWPWWVVQFGQRAYFGLNPATFSGGVWLPTGQPAVVATDVLSLKVTNAGQTLTFGDSQQLTAGAAMGLSNQLGGIIQALMVFKGQANIHQVTGDFAGGTWSVNSLNVATGTKSARAIVRTPIGLAFISPQGMRIIDQNANVSDPIGYAGEGVALPFTTLIFPTRACGSCDGTTLRICFVVNFASGQNVYAEYWYNLALKRWSGPHTIPSGQQDVWQGNFILTTPPLVPPNGQILLSLTAPVASSTYVELGTQLNFTMQTILLPDSGQMAEQALTEMRVVGGCNSSETVTVTLIDPDGNTIDTSTATLATTGLRQRPVNFTKPEVFERMSVQLTGASAAGLRLGDVWLRMRELGYAPGQLGQP